MNKQILKQIKGLQLGDHVQMRWFDERATSGDCDL